MITLSVPLILASQSPRRSLLLKQIGLTFRVEPSSIAEEIDLTSSSEENVRRLAFHKAQEIAQRHNDGVGIGYDTIVVIEG